MRTQYCANSGNGRYVDKSPCLGFKRIKRKLVGKKALERA